MQTVPLSPNTLAVVAQLESLRATEQWPVVVNIARTVLGQIGEHAPSADRAALLIRLARAHSELGEISEAETIQASGLAAVKESGAEDMRAQWDLNASLIAYRKGELDSAERHAYACLASADLLQGELTLEGPAHNNIGLIALHRGEWSVARRHLLAAVSSAERAGDGLAVSNRRMNYALASYFGGFWTDAREAASTARKEARLAAAPRIEARSHILDGTLDRAEGKHGPANEHLAAARMLANRCNNQRELALCDELEGDLALDAKDLEVAAVLYTRTVETGLRIAPKGDLVYEGKRKLAEARRRQGNYPEAMELAEDALALARLAGSVVEIAATLRTLSLTHEAVGNRGSARAGATEGVALLRNAGERYELMQTLIACADFLDDASTLLVEARGLAAHLGLTEVVRAVDERLTPPSPLAVVGGSGMALIASDAESPDKQGKPLRVEALHIAGGRVFLTTDIRIVADVRRAMRNQDRVLIEGETGTGKELVARLLHENSPRKGGPFICVECTSLHESLAQSELFGHAKGSFTGAHAEGKGLVEAANGGTLFLDEVGDLSPALQGRLLRLLQEREFRPVGSASAKAVDLFVISATNRDLVAMVDKGEFRRDLYYRIKGAVVRVPPLRERPDDILALADHFLRVHGERRNRHITLSPQVRTIMRRYAWPGNARQMENEIGNIVSQLEDGATADTWVLSPEIVAGAMGGAVGPLTFKDRVDALIVSEVQRCLRATGGNRARTADLMGFSRRGLQKMLKRLGLVGEPAARTDDDSED